MTWARRLLIAALTLPTFCGIAVASTSSTEPSGPALYHAEVRALARVHTIHLRETGAAIDSALGRMTYAHWMWSTSRPPTGWVPARAVGTIGVSRGRVVWTEVELIPDTSHCGRLCGQVAVIVVGEGSATYYTFGTFAHQDACFARAHGPFYDQGDRIAATADHVAAPRRRGAELLLTFTYRWQGGRRVTETDTVAPATDLPLSEVLRVSSDPGNPAFSLRASYRYGPGHAPPSLRLCR
jgi:hypothetical protein